jgi:hypothetical protein
MVSFKRLGNAQPPIPPQTIEWEDEGQHEDDEDEDVVELSSALMLPGDISSLDAEVLSTLPQSVQLEVLEKMRDSQAAGERAY